MDPQRLTKYTPTALEKAQKHALLTEPDLGIHIDLIEPEAYDPPATGAPLLEEDNELLLAAEEPDKPSSSKIDAKARPNVPWLHKTAYYGNDDLYGFQQGSKPIVDLPIPILQEVKELTPKQLAEKVNETFDAPRALDQLKHPFKKDITPVETWEVFPDRERWANDYAELVFDQDPVADDEELKKASGLIRKRVAGNAVVHLTPPENPAAEDDSMTYSYFLPAPGSKKRRRLVREARKELGEEEGAADDEGEEEGEEEGGALFHCQREYCENEARKYQEEWRDDHFVISFVKDEAGVGKALFHPIKARTYLRKSKHVFTRHQLVSLDAEKKREMRRKGTRAPKHLDARISDRPLTSQEVHAAREKIWSIEGDPLAMRGGGAGDREEEEEEEEGKGKGSASGGARRSVAAESDSESEGSEPARRRPPAKRPSPSSSDSDSDPPITPSTPAPPKGAPDSDSDSSD